MRRFNNVHFNVAPCAECSGESLINMLRIEVASCSECGPESLLDTVALGVQVDGQIVPYRLCARHLRELGHELEEMQRAVDQLLAERPPRETP